MHRQLFQCSTQGLEMSHVVAGTQLVIGERSAANKTEKNGEMRNLNKSL